MKNYHLLVTWGYIAILAVILAVMRSPIAFRVGLLIFVAISFAIILRRIRTAPKS
ncbi:MAG TPA: hypothetical protein VNE63_23955 [Candidatus Acidoferrales bacterium]|nr:hypothetical protein [Candidatus Acidoferrales bacterium]